MNSPTIDKQRIEEVILDAIRTTNLAREPENQLQESTTAPLYTEGSPLDSLGLVSLLMEVEEGLREEGVEMSLSDERAMSQKQSPFRDVPSLVRYVEGVLSEMQP